MVTTIYQTDRSFGQNKVTLKDVSYIVALVVVHFVRDLYSGANCLTRAAPIVLNEVGKLLAFVQRK